MPSTIIAALSVQAAPAQKISLGRSQNRSSRDI